MKKLFHCHKIQNIKKQHTYYQSITEEILKRHK